MASREGFFGCTYTVGDFEIMEWVVRAWEPGEAVEIFSVALREAEVERPGLIAVRDHTGRVRQVAPFPPARGGPQARRRAVVAAVAPAER